MSLSRNSLVLWTLFLSLIFSPPVQAQRDHFSALDAAKIELRAECARRFPGFLNLLEKWRCQQTLIDALEATDRERRQLERQRELEAQAEQRRRAAAERAVPCILERLPRIEGSLTAVRDSITPNTNFNDAVQLIDEKLGRAGSFRESASNIFERIYINTVHLECGTNFRFLVNLDEAANGMVRALRVFVYDAPQNYRPNERGRNDFFPMFSRDPEREREESRRIEQERIAREEALASAARLRAQLAAAAVRIPAELPSAQTQGETSAFVAGLADRTAWEIWLQGLSAPGRAGAEFWATQRSLPRPAACSSTDAVFQDACETAQRRLSPTDARRRAEPDYRQGWNSFLPMAYRRSVLEAMQMCRAEGRRPSLGRNFETARDLNGDGLTDYVLDYGAFACGERSSEWCGTGGCRTEIYLSTPSGFVRAFDDLVRTWQVQPGERAVFTFTIHGIACSLPGPAECTRRLVWDGTRLR